MSISETEFDDVKSQLEKLQRQGRCWRWCCLLALLGGLCLGAESTGRVAAQQFVVTDESGQSRAELGYRNGIVALRLYDEAGAERVYARVTSRDVGFGLFDTQGRVRAEFAIVPTDASGGADSVGVRFKNAEGAEVGSLKILEDGEGPTLQSQGSTTQAVVRATGFTVQDGSGETLLQAGVSDGRPQYMIRDNPGKPIRRLP